MTDIFEHSYLSIPTGKLPDEWVKANVAPVFKKVDRHTASNYRPISLTCVCAKLLEHIICKNIMTHFTKKKIRAEHSCESLLLLTTEDPVQNYEDKTQTDLIVLDFSKAFDVVPHQCLLHKLDHYGIRGPTLLWIQNFLTTQTQKVVVDGSFSDTGHVGSGVLQGTVGLLGSILFPCYNKDLLSSVSSDVRLFADDCLLYGTIKSKDDQKKLQEDLTKMDRWADIWGMKFNPSKCTVLRVKRPRAKEIASDYQLEGVTLAKVSNSPYL